MNDEEVRSSAISAPRSSLTCPFPPRTLPALVFLLLLVGVAYAGALQNGFALDDAVMIEQNALITRLDYLPRLATTDYWAGRRAPTEAVPWRSGLYRPLVLVTYALNYAAAGLRPFGYHLANVGLHGLVTWLVYLIALRLAMGPEAALVAAAIFAVHPLHSEAVVGIVGRAELLMAAGVLGALWSAACGRSLLSVGLFALGLFSKEQAVVLPLVVMLSHLCFRKALSARGLLPLYGGYAVVLALYLLVRALALKDLYSVPALFLDNPLAHLDGYLRALNAIQVAGRYLWLCVWPVSLSADYSYNAIPLAGSPWEPGVLLGVLGWAVLLGLAGWSFLRGTRRSCFAIGLTVATFLPGSNLIVPIGTIMGERLFYLPSAGLCLLAGLAYEWATRNAERTMRKAALIALRSSLIVLCLALTARTVARSQDWADTEALMRSAARAVPGSAKVHAVLGGVALTKEDWATSLEHFQTAMGLYPDYIHREVTINLNLGTALMRNGRMTEALRAFERAAALDSRSSVTRLSLSRILFALGRYEEALTEADAAVQLRGDLPDAHAVRARALQALGRADEAGIEWRRPGGEDAVPGLMGRKTR
jgi:tetratricopeptide (TPR) repeat protein